MGRASSPFMPNATLDAVPTRSLINNNNNTTINRWPDLAALVSLLLLLAKAEGDATGVEYYGRYLG